MNATLAPTRPSPITIEQLADELDAHYEAEGRSDDYRTRQRRLLSFLVTKLDVLTAPDLDAPGLEERYLAARPADESEGTRRGALNRLRAARRRARKLGMIGPDPRARRAKAPRRDLSPAELGAYVSGLRPGDDTWEGQRLLILALLALGTNLGRRELLRLEWDQVDIKARTIGSAGEAIPPRLIPGLRAWKKAARTDHVFPGKAGRGHWNSYYAGTGLEPAHQIAEAGRAVGLEGVTLEVLRRCRAADLDPGARPIPVLPASRTPAGRLVPATLEPAGVTTLVASLRAQAGEWEGHRDLVVFGLMLLDGLSLRSILRLEVGDFDREEGTIPTGDSRRTRKLSPEAAALVAGWLDRADQWDWPWIFPGPLLLSPWGGSGNGEAAHDRLLEVAGTLQLGHVTPLSLSRFHGSYRGRRAELLEAIGPIEPPAPILGGPCPRPTGPTSKGGRARTRVPHWTHRAMAAARAKATPPVAVRSGIEGLLELGDSHEVPPLVLDEEGTLLPENGFRVYRYLIRIWPEKATERELDKVADCCARWAIKKAKEAEPNLVAITHSDGRGGKGISLAHPAGHPPPPEGYRAWNRARRRAAPDAPPLPSTEIAP